MQILRPQPRLSKSSKCLCISRMWDRFMSAFLCTCLMASTWWVAVCSTVPIRAVIDCMLAWRSVIAAETVALMSAVMICRSVRQRDCVAETAWPPLSHWEGEVLFAKDGCSSPEATWPFAAAIRNITGMLPDE